MQLKFITATLAAFAVSNTLAGPLPVENNNAALENAPLSNPVLTPRAAQWADVQLEAAQFAAAHSNQVLSYADWGLIQQYWPGYRFTRRNAMAALWFTQNRRNWLLQPGWRTTYPFMNRFDWLDRYNDLDFNDWND